ACNRTRYVQHNGVLVVNSTVSSQVLNASGVTSVEACAMLCGMKSCSAAVFWKSSGLCQLVTVSREPGFAGNNEWRLLGSETAEAVVMKLENFEELMKPRIINVTRVFTNNGTGRIGSVQLVTIDIAGCYRIELAGAKGGDNTYVSPDKLGGRGALAAGNVSLSVGVQLSIVVGQAG
uniref:receptor protein-tyrosine kinase n=1 Tax=Macrostomum lignano TaxID=282301 RepID=A0A1I8H2Y1_9PLAT